MYDTAKMEKLFMSLTDEEKQKATDHMLLLLTEACGGTSE